jgi:hypothetical protein
MLEWYTQRYQRYILFGLAAQKQARPKEDGVSMGRGLIHTGTDVAD